MASKPSGRKPYTLFAADPGERTGVVLVRVAADFSPDTAEPDTFTIKDQDVWTVRQVGAFAKSWIKEADVVAYETWRLYGSYAMAMVGNDMQPSQVVGMIRYVAWELGRKIESNGAHIKKASFARMPEWLREHMAKSSEQHDQDAIMHAWFVAMNRYYREQK